MLLLLLACPEYNKDLLPLHLRVLSSAGGCWRAVVDGSLQNRVLDDVDVSNAWLVCTEQHNFPPVQTWRYSTKRVRIRKTRLPCSTAASIVVPQGLANLALD